MFLCRFQQLMAKWDPAETQTCKLKFGSQALYPYMKLSMLLHFFSSLQFMDNLLSFTSSRIIFDIEGDM